MTEKTIGNLALDDKENAGSKTPASLADLQKLPAANDPKYNVPVADFVARHTAKQAQNISDQASAPDDKKKNDSYNPDLSTKSWIEDESGKRWDSTAKGRAIERVLSRGLFGAAAFAWGGWYASRSHGMSNYTPDIKWSEIDSKKPLQYIAKSIDTFAGKPIKAVASLFTDDPERFIFFRPTNNQTMQKHGRSLGHEAVGLTFDFFCASVVDAGFRGLRDAFDPHIKHMWRDENGNINPLETLKQTGKSLFRYVSYNGGEDWAVAVPYAYFVRAQRKLIRQFSPRWNYDSDRGLNGGCFKIDNEGKVIGNFNIEGMLDLQSRFTVYNIGTLMFREAYNHIGNAISGHAAPLYGAADGNKENHTIGSEIGDLAKWTARSVIKGVITMTPAVPFFSLFRTPQSKYKGLFINQDVEDGGVLGYSKPDGNGGLKDDMLHVHELNRSDKYYRENAPDVTLRRFKDDKWEIVSAPLKNHPLSNPNKPFDPYGQSFGIIDKGLNAVGKAQNFVRSKVNDIPEKLIGERAPSKRIINDYVNAAFSYTPYMFAKRETQLLWDNGKMDMAAERLIDGATHLNLKEVKAGAGEIWKTLKQEKLDDKDHEEEAQKRINQDPSPAFGVTKADADYMKKHGYNIPFFEREQPEISWKDRIVQAPPKEAKNRDELKYKPIPKRSDKYSDNEMAAMLASLNPPSKSIH